MVLPNSLEARMKAVSRTSSSVIALFAAGALVLSACGSGDENAVDENAVETVVSETTEEAIAAEPLDAAGLACANFFELDLLMSQYGAGMVAAGDMTEAQVKREYRRIIGEVVAQGEIAVAEGEIEPRIVNNAKRLQNAAGKMKKKNTFSNMPRAQRNAMNTRMTRIERTCARAGYPLPDENVMLRADVASG
jgi:hypothetical protein